MSRQLRGDLTDDSASGTAKSPSASVILGVIAPALAATAGK